MQGFFSERARQIGLISLNTRLRYSSLKSEQYKVAARPTLHKTMETPSISINLGRSNSNKRSKSVPLHRCRFPDHVPSSITSLAITPTTFDSSVLEYGSTEGVERGILAVGRSNGQVELMVWGGYQGWVNWRVSLLLYIS